MPPLNPANLLPHLGAYSSWLTAAAPPRARVVPASELLEPSALRAHVQEIADGMNTKDLRAAGSLWNKHYNASVLYGALAAMTFAGVGLDMSVPNMSVVLVGGWPKGAVLHDRDLVTYSPRLPEGLSGGRPASLAELHRFVITNAFEQHLVHHFRAARLGAGVPTEVLWSNAGNLIAAFYDDLDPTGPATAADRAAFLEDRGAPVGRNPNPFIGAVYYEPLHEPELPNKVRIRNVCCLRYRVDSYKPCYTCPRLTPEERIALMTELVRKERL